MLGRRDFQVKVRGYRVQLSEIEERLFDLGGIGEAVVIALDEPDGDKRLVAYLSAQGAVPPTTSALRTALARRLPEYMIPSAFVFLPKLPLTSGGKVDRRALPFPPKGRPELSNPYVAPRTALEEQLVGIWEEVLPIAPVGVDDDFFELGGDSLSASRVIAGILRRLGIGLSPRKMFDCPSISTMAIAIAAEQSSSNADEMVPGSPRRSSR
jgi:hypothetical protein